MRQCGVVHCLATAVGRAAVLPARGGQGVTLDDMHAAWLRWMHRMDLETDLAVVDDLTYERIRDRLMYGLPDAAIDPVTNLSALCVLMPRVVHHAGLVSLHELAQDDEGLSRELGLLDGAITDWHFRRSIDQGPGRPANPWTERAREDGAGAVYPRSERWV